MIPKVPKSIPRLRQFLSGSFMFRNFALKRVRGRAAPRQFEQVRLLSVCTVLRAQKFNKPNEVMNENEMSQLDAELEFL